MDKKEQFEIIETVNIEIFNALARIDDWMGKYKEGSRKWKRLHKTRELIASAMCDIENLAYDIDKE